MEALGSEHDLHLYRSIRVSSQPCVRLDGQMLWSSVVEEALGNERGLLSALRVKDLRSGAVRDLEVSGLFFAIGHEPASAFLGGQARPRRVTPGHVGHWTVLGGQRASRNTTLEFRSARAPAVHMLTT